jgi:hypothetical protein
MNDGTSSSRIITSRSDFHAAIREGFAQAAAQGCREIFISDADFADWPLGERAVVEHLTQWAYAHRRFTMLAQHYDEVTRRHPRFVEWRRQWSHVIDCQAFTEAEAEAGHFPSMLVASGLFTLRLLDPVHHRASLSAEVGDELRAREQLDAFLQRSTPSFPATIAGL